eukprot:TRINITY_DN3461_c0_g2_i1.p1 TRINITY_DN3461_c0_g2~~TRINITY_DN3461_c0_g2_i1.p1  ORF type:complete len:551 (-),score=133.01 TRINITY_DN3461_c0_g2_i1:34-1686(-)
MFRMSGPMAGLMQWCQLNTAGYAHVNVTNFSTSFRDGLVWCALLHKFHPDKIDFSSLKPEDCAKNLDLAFTVAEDLGVPRLLDVEDMLMERPEPKSVMTYTSEFYRKLAAPKQQQQPVAAPTQAPPASPPSTEPLWMQRIREKKTAEAAAKAQTASPVKPAAPQPVSAPTQLAHPVVAPIPAAAAPPPSQPVQSQQKPPVATVAAQAPVVQAQTTHVNPVGPAPGTQQTLSEPKQNPLQASKPLIAQSQAPAASQLQQAVAPASRQQQATPPAQSTPAAGPPHLLKKPSQTLQKQQTPPTQLKPAATKEKERSLSQKRPVAHTDKPTTTPRGTLITPRGTTTPRGTGAAAQAKPKSPTGVVGKPGTTSVSVAGKLQTPSTAIAKARSSASAATRTHTTTALHVVHHHTPEAASTATVKPGGSVAHARTGSRSSAGSSSAVHAVKPPTSAVGPKADAPAIAPGSAAGMATAAAHTQHHHTTHPTSSAQPAEPAKKREYSREELLAYAKKLQARLKASNKEVEDLKAELETERGLRRRAEEELSAVLKKTQH